MIMNSSFGNSCDAASSTDRRFEFRRATTTPSEWIDDDTIGEIGSDEADGARPGLGIGVIISMTASAALWVLAFAPFVSTY
jgi:hypothetical protein